MAKHVKRTPAMENQQGDDHHLCDEHEEEEEEEEEEDLAVKGCDWSHLFSLRWWKKTGNYCKHVPFDDDDDDDDQKGRQRSEVKRNTVSRLLAGLKLKNLFREIGGYFKNKKKQQKKKRNQFYYSPQSYALNFDAGGLGNGEEDHIRHDPSSSSARRSFADKIRQKSKLFQHANRVFSIEVCDYRKSVKGKR